MKARQKGQAQAYLASFKPETRYDIRPANGGAPGVSFHSCLEYLPWPKMYQAYLILAKTLEKNVWTINHCCITRRVTKSL